MRQESIGHTGTQCGAEVRTVTTPEPVTVNSAEAYVACFPAGVLIANQIRTY